VIIDRVIQNGIKSFDPDDKYEKIEAQSIYYKNRADFKAWQTYKCIQNHSSLRKPELEHCSSNNFCVEAWREKK